MSERSRSGKEPKKTKNIWLILGPILLLIIGVGGFFFYRYYQGEQRAKASQELVNTYLSQLKKGNYEELSSYFDKKSITTAGYTPQELVEKYSNIYSGIGAEGLKASQIKVTKGAGEEFEFSYQLAMSTSLGELKDLTYQGKIDYSGAKPLLEWAPKLVLPGMSGKDKINISLDAAVRGEIVDRDDRPLAQNGTLLEVGVVPGKLGTATEREANIKAIAEAFSLTESAIETALDQTWVKDDYFVPLKTVTSVQGEMPTGATTKEVTGRTYPLAEKAAQLIGYLGAVTAEDIEKNPQLTSGSQVGRTGLEAAFDQQLRGQDGGKIAITTEAGEEKHTLLERPKKDGETIRLTIDRQLQLTAFDALAGKAGATVVTAPKSGDLLALVSSPSYDPNKMTHGISQADYEAYEQNEAQPFMSRFATGYAPGSTFKTITAAIGLDNGTIDPNEQLTISGLKWQKDTSWGSYQVTRVANVPTVDLRTALVQSDNIYMAQMTLKMGEDKFRAGLAKFGFGEKSTLPIAENPAQISNEKSFDSEILLADTGYGQGQLLMDPIQQATMYSVFTNGGTMVYPRIQVKDGEAVKEQANVIKESSAQTVVADLKEVVTDANGTAHSLNSLGIELAAKTGTAEIKTKQDEKGQENSFLLAFDPTGGKYLMVSLLENRQGEESATQLAPSVLQYLNSVTYE